MDFMTKRFLSTVGVQFKLEKINIFGQKRNIRLIMNFKKYAIIAYIFL